MSHSENPVFQETYADYLAQLKEVDPAVVAEVLGADLDGNGLRIALYGRPYRVSPDGIVNARGGRASFETCVILSKYVLLCPDDSPQQLEWVSFKDFKDTAPLIGYMTKDVEGALARRCSGRLKDLQEAVWALGAKPSTLDVRYDLAAEFAALPKIAVTLLFNDADDEFPAACTVLFQRRAEQHLDGECIAMLAGRLLPMLNRVMGAAHRTTEGGVSP